MSQGHDAERFRFSRHARNRLRSRTARQFGVTPEHVIETVLAPDALAPTIRGRMGAWKRYGDRWLRVVYRETPDEIIVVTVISGDDGPDQGTTDA